jgi:metal-responsive CopG/Arc/MetJ family transcriptional regulator
MNMATVKPRYTVSVDNDMFQQIEDFRFERRFQTRSEATVELIRLGLEALKKEQEEQKKAQKNKSSQKDTK